MAHGLDESRNDEIMYSKLGGIPWHGLGTPLPGLATAAEVIEVLPAFGSEVVKVQAEYKGKAVLGQYWNVDQSTGLVVSNGTVSEQYTVMQNRELLEFMDDLTRDPRGPKYETAGTLWNGRKAWALAKMPDGMDVAGDQIDAYLLISNSHDKSQAVRIQTTSIRVVCNNTLGFAQRGAKANASVRHSGRILNKVSEVASTLGLIYDDLKLTSDLFNQLAETEPTKAQVETVLTALFPDTKSNRAELQRGRVLSLAEAGTGNAQHAGTAWALFNGVTELVDHVNNRDSDRDDADSMRLNNIWLGSGAKLKADALETISEVVLA